MKIVHWKSVCGRPTKTHFVHSNDSRITWCGYKIPDYAYEGESDTQCKSCRNKGVKRGKKKE